MPALLTRMSRRPKLATVVSMRRSTSVASLTSATTARLLPPAATIAEAVVCVVSRLRPFTVTAAPAPAKPSAIARPRPRLLPVTMATFPFSENWGSTSIELRPLHSRYPARITLDAFPIVFPQNCQLLGLQRSLSMDRESGLIAPEVTGREIRNQVDHA